MALAALSNWRTRKKFADSIISDLFEASDLPDRERAFALELFYGVLRNLTLLDFWIGKLRTGRMDPALRDLLRLGIYQLFLIQTARHAAVNETVGLAPMKRRAVANAVLRNAIRNENALREIADEQPAWIQWSHPEFLFKRWQKNFGESSALELCAWNNRPPPIYGRINRLKITPAEFVRRYPGSFILPNHENFAELPNGAVGATMAGDCYIQDPSTALACEALAPRPGETVLDACAAPGGKTTYLAELMRNDGTLIACDRDPVRLKRLEENLSRLGVSISTTVQHDWETPRHDDKIKSYGPFDRILIDAPCSNTGVMRRRVDVRWRLQPPEFAQIQERQFAILATIAGLLKPDGVLVYSTCSIEPEENEMVAEQIAARMNWNLETKSQLLPFRDHFDGAFAARFVANR